MTKQIFPKLPPNASKADEIDYLEQIAAQLPLDSYLASLFSAGLRQWAINKIREDVSPDIYDYFNVAAHQAQAAEAVVSQYRQALDKAEQEQAELSQQWRMQAQENERQAKCEKEIILANYEREHRVYLESNTAMAVRVQELEAQRNGLNDDLRDAFERVISMEAEVIRLKAEIYDLEHGKEGGVA